MIYNIRPKKWYSASRRFVSKNFSNKEQFLEAIYKTLEWYRGKDFAKDWLADIKRAYKARYKKELDVN